MGFGCCGYGKMFADWSRNLIIRYRWLSIGEADTLRSSAILQQGEGEKMFYFLCLGRENHSLPIACEKSVEVIGFLLVHPVLHFLENVPRLNGASLIGDYYRLLRLAITVNRYNR